MGNKEEKKKTEEYKKRLEHFKSDVLALFHQTTQDVIGGFSLRPTIQIQDVRLTTCRYVEVALDSAIDLCRLALLDKVEHLEHKIKNILLPSVHFPIDNLLTHLVNVFKTPSEEDKNKNNFIGFDRKYKWLTNYLFLNSDLKDDQILNYNEIRNSLHGNYADLDGNYQLVNLRDLLDLLKIVVEWLYKVYQHEKINQNSHIYDEASKAYYAELCKQKDIKKKPKLKNFDEKELQNLGMQHTIGVATYPKIEAIKPGMKVYIAAVFIHPEKIYKWMHYLTDPSKLNSEQLNLLFAILKEHEDVCLNQIIWECKIDGDVEESVRRAMRDCVNELVDKEFFAQQVCARLENNDKKLAWLEANPPINRLENYLLMVEGACKPVQKPWCKSFSKGAGQSLSIAAAAILVKGHKEWLDDIDAKMKKQHADI
jgi:ribonuclease HII